MVNGAALEQLRFLTGTGHLREALEYLNALSSCRFTAIYRFDAERLHNLVLYDRESPQAALMDTIPTRESYCTYVEQSRDAFIVVDANGDDRVATHPKRPIVKSYYGFPLLGAGETLFGTLCQFDFDVVALSDEILDLMREFAGFLDPRHALDAFASDLEQRLETLKGMTDLIVSVSDTADAAVAAIEEYAEPLRNDARKGLGQAQADAFKARIDALARQVASAVGAR